MSITVTTSWHLIVLVAAALLLVVRTSLEPAEQWRSGASLTVAISHCSCVAASRSSLRQSRYHWCWPSTPPAPLRPLWDKALDRMVRSAGLNHFLGGISGESPRSNLLFTPTRRCATAGYVIRPDVRHHRRQPGIPVAA
jgi:hypothetical protein